MPIFEYSCKSCGHRFEKLSFGQDGSNCPSCGAENTSRQLSTFAVGSKGGSSPMSDISAGGCGSCGDPRGPGACSMD